jgi:hypothetical protein
MIQPNILIFIIIGFIISVLSLIFKKAPNYNLVPKKIWTYWDNPDKPVQTIPKSVKLCMDSWAKHNPDYEITLLTRANYKGFITIPEEIRNNSHFNDSPARFSDLVRLYVLEEHGGIWIDASVLVKEPFNKWLFPKYAEFAGYYMGSITEDPKSPALESWFLAANRGSKFIKLWKKEFLEIADFKDIQAYLDSRQHMGVKFKNIRDPHYLAIYIAALKVFQIDKYPLDSLILRDSEEGPFKYLKDSLWYPDRAMKLACSNQAYQKPLLKMRSDERRILDKELDFTLSCDKCGWLS